jgi:2-oxo-4-hydroxy-4-carboxy-5-ureidoimidazoline decarboxylase
MIAFAWINTANEQEAHAAFLRCCGARRWAEQMTAHRPYRDEDYLLDAARAGWRALEVADWREAFAAHPQIGGQAPRSSATAAWSAGEQAGVTGSPEATRAALADGNRRYLAKFGWIFIVCATGKSANEMLALLEQRLANDPAEELEIAAVEQEKILLLRLQKLDHRLEPGGS